MKMRNIFLSTFVALSMACVQSMRVGGVNGNDQVRLQCKFKARQPAVGNSKKQNLVYLFGWHMDRLCGRKTFVGTHKHFTAARDRGLTILRGHWH
jgi:hypothetical protein